MENNLYIETIKSSAILSQTDSAGIIRRHVDSMDRLTRIGVALDAAGIEYSAASIAAKHILDGSRAQYYFNFLRSDFNAVIGIMREVK